MTTMSTDELATRRRQAKRTAMIAGGIALGIFVMSIVQMLKI
ncbi:hypothetical protein GCM10009552_03690 [Rothia nasimurium]|nr:hypothetical protein [Luteibacter anthropi]